MSSVIRGDDNFDSGHDLGVGQTWQNLTASRASGTIYQNITGKPIMVFISIQAGTLDDSAVQVSTDQATWIAVGSEFSTANSVNFIVPNNHYYRVNGAGINKWSELR